VPEDNRVLSRRNVNMLNRKISRKVIKDKRKRVPNPKKVNVCIIMPCGLDRKIDGAAAIWCATQVVQWKATWDVIPGRQAEDSRNHGIRKYLEYKDFTHFFFLDADTIPPGNCLKKLLKHDKPFVAGVTPIYDWNMDRKTWNVSMSRCHKELIKRDPDELPKKLFKAQGVGGTTLLIKREVLLRMEQPYFFTRRDWDGSVMLSEDLFFTNEVLELGYNLWVDPSIKCVHRQTNDLT